MKEPAIDPRDAEQVQVKWCPHCRCTTWFFNGKCEWPHDAKLVRSWETVDDRN